MLVVVAMTLCATASKNLYNICRNLPGDSVVSMGNTYMYDRRMYDSALVCFTVVTNRCGSDGKLCSGSACVDAYIGEWYIYFFQYYDYAKSLESLFAAEEVAEKSGLVRPDIYMDLGCTYQTIAEECNDTSLYEKALEFYCKAVDQSFDNDPAILNISVTNLITTAHVLDRMDVVSKWWDKYCRKDMGKYNRLADYNKQTYAYAGHLRGRRYDDALSALSRQVEICGNDPFFVRYLALTYINMGKVYVESGKYDEAVSLFKKALGIAVGDDMKDAKLELYKLLADVCKTRGDIELSNDYSEKYLDIKDSLLNYHQLKSVSEIRFLGDIKKIGNELTEMKYRNYLLNILFYVAIFVLVIVASLVVVLFMKNRKLRQSYVFMYKKNLEELQTDEDERNGNGEIPPSENSEVEPAIDEKEPEERKNSCDIMNVDEIYSRIRQVMENNEVVFSPEFSAEVLASLVGEKQRVVSQVLKYKTNSNFYSLLSRYRIKEVCKRFHDETNYKNLTIEAIAHSVGFKSRSNFCTTFKGIVGMNPSEYIKMVKEGI